MGTFNLPGLTHSQRVCRLYMATIQMIWSYQWKDMDIQRRDMVRVRHLLDKNKDIKDPKKQRMLYEEWVGLFDKYKHPEPIIHPWSPEGTAYDRQVYFPKHIALATPEQSWWVKEWQLDRNISGLKEYEWDKRPGWRSLITRNNRRSHLRMLYEEWVGLFDKYKHPEPIIHPWSPEGTAYDRQVYFPKHIALATPEQSWWVKEWQLDRNISGLKEYEWDKRPGWRSLITRNNRRSHLVGYEDDV
eukprot:sb/3468941/